MKNLTEKDKVESVIVNTVFYGISLNSMGAVCNLLNEALKWAKHEKLFPELTSEEFLAVARKYEVWNDFEQRCVEAGHNIELN